MGALVGLIIGIVLLVIGWWLHKDATSKSIESLLGVLLLIIGFIIVLVCALSFIGVT
jgi:hypothetical protein